METNNAKQTEEKGNNQKKTSSKAKGSFDILGTLISVAGALGLDYVLFIKPLQDKIENYLKKIDELESQIKKQDEKQQNSDKRIKELEQKLLNIEDKLNTSAVRIKPVSRTQPSGVPPPANENKERQAPFLFKITNYQTNQKEP
jgi:chromosome segregation ATPase